MTEMFMDPGEDSRGANSLPLSGRLLRPKISWLFRTPYLRLSLLWAVLSRCCAELPYGLLPDSRRHLSFRLWL